MKILREHRNNMRNKNGYKLIHHDEKELDKYLVPLDVLAKQIYANHLKSADDIDLLSDFIEEVGTREDINKLHNTTNPYNIWRMAFDISLHNRIDINDEATVYHLITTNGKDEIEEYYLNSQFRFFPAMNKHYNWLLNKLNIKVVIKYHYFGGPDVEFRRNKNYKFEVVDEDISWKVDIYDYVCNLLKELGELQ